MTLYLLLFMAGLIAGAMNAVAGGGSFVSFPVLVYTGVPSVSANVSSTIALFPGSFASALAYRDDFQNLDGISVRSLFPVSLAGGLVGALLLLYTSEAAFDVIIPWLLLLATVTFAFGRQLGSLLRRVVRIGRSAVLAMQFVIAIYGGYFGGAVGIMMMAMWSLFGVNDLRAVNAAKTLLVGATNTIAVVCFIVLGEVWWPQTLTLLVAAVIGGYVGARVARRLNQTYLRIGITMLNTAMTTAFFVRAG